MPQNTNPWLFPNFKLILETFHIVPLSHPATSTLIHHSSLTIRLSELWFSYYYYCSLTLAPQINLFFYQRYPCHIISPSNPPHNHLSIGIGLIPQSQGHVHLIPLLKTRVPSHSPHKTLQLCLKVPYSKVYSFILYIQISFLPPILFLVKVQSYYSKFEKYYKYKISQLFKNQSTQKIPISELPGTLALKITDIPSPRHPLKLSLSSYHQIPSFFHSSIRGDAYPKIFTPGMNLKS